MDEDDFRYDGYAQRAWKSKKARTSPRSPQIVRPPTNEGKVIAITHIGMRKVGGIVSFLYHFVPLKAGYADLYFLAPDSLVSPWLKTHDRSFYEADSIELRGLVERREVYALTAPVPAVHGERLIKRGHSLSLCSLAGNSRFLGLFEDLIAQGPTRHF